MSRLHTNWIQRVK